MTEESSVDLLDAPADPDAGGAATDGLERPEPAPSAEAAPPAPLFQGYTRAFTAICSLAAAALHVIAMIDHVDHHPTLGRAFFMVAVLQVAWAGMLVRGGHRLTVALGGLLTLAAFLVWVFSRTTGISWFSGLEEVEAIGWRDLTTQAFQLLALAGAVVLLLPARVFGAPRGDERPAAGPIAVMALLAMAAVTFVYAATHGQVHPA